MNHALKRQARYFGPLRLAIFDLAGTIVDYGSMAPSGAFVELFARHGIALSDAEARGPMGMHKRDHIAALLVLPSVARQWVEKTGQVPDDAARDALYNEFVPLQTRVLPRFADLIPGTLETMEALRKLGMRIAVDTGYSRDMMNIVLARAAEQGFRPDAAVSGEEVPSGRPAPWMAQECARRLGLFPMAACIHLGDTKVDVVSGRNAGMWSAGVAATGNLAALPLTAWQNLDEAARAERIRSAQQTLFEVGAHAVIDSVVDLPDLIKSINNTMAKGGGLDGDAHPDA